jgi:hypothetical protein
VRACEHAADKYHKHRPFDVCVQYSLSLTLFSVAVCRMGTAATMISTSQGTEPLYKIASLYRVHGQALMLIPILVVQVLQISSTLHFTDDYVREAR